MSEVVLRVLWSRAAVFFLASLSFACLLGQFYSFWSMQFFACWILLPATLLLTVMAFVSRNRHALRLPHVWITQGAIGGIVAAVAYDLYRLPFVLNGAPFFKVFPRFGLLILGETEPSLLAHLLGWAYHFSNGAALGIMFLTFVPRPGPRILFWGAVAWALVVECLLLLTPYTTFFGLQLNAQFLFLTASAHLVFGLALGWWCWKRVPARWPDMNAGLLRATR
jgi:hypothetical protein